MSQIQIGVLVGMTVTAVVEIMKQRRACLSVAFSTGILFAVAMTVSATLLDWVVHS